MGVPIETIIAKFEEWIGTRYEFGGEDSNCEPNDIDCSEGVERACVCTGVTPTMIDGSANQFNHCDNAGLRISFDEARNTRGALIFKSYGTEYPPGDRDSGGIYHVAMSLGNNTTMEICCSNGDSVGHMSVSGRSWYGWGARIPGADYPSGGGGVDPEPWDGNANYHRTLLWTNAPYNDEFGMRKGEDVRWVQTYLKVGADGHFGQGTDNAVRAFQKSKGLAVDGQWGKNTASAAGHPGASGGTPPPSGGTPFPLPSGHWFGQVSSNSKNHSGSGLPSDHPDRVSIRKIQAKVGKTQDGLFGPDTESGVRTWQSGHGLVVDGDCGAKTWASMFG